MDKLEIAFALFDEYNKKDPSVFVYDGQEYPQEYFFALKLHEWVLKLDPQANEELLLASRCQHIGRWESPRESYPPGREAYLSWRKNLALHHADVASTLLREAGYGDQEVERVREILLKKRIKLDPDVQTIENALCLVFLQYQYEVFRKRYEDDPEKMVNILHRSLLKMDTQGHAFALQLNYSEEGLKLVNEAVALITKKS
ncbi:DUF4202 domain-containing protein [Mucilaginibacter limnophilus]|uniref:DUF4202 domain-containing protein n=1 Tax=Mucilaginibacter limnophilus TaxID=1932778 RepID=A0A437MRT9_9SPHI|nr:DUF4202 domain-containing protein [Mucilaginibacter limnophilus]RVU00356.1 DUF4202 domain-containing protein [Mucilaginibacter limnophilus]